MPRISVVLPNYNYARYLHERVRSILNQTFSDLELIYIDDGSADESNAIIAEFAGDPRVRTVLHQENSGRVYQRWNEAAELATGDWLWFAGADDSAHPRFLAELLRLAERRPDASILYCRQALIDSTGRLLRTIRHPEFEDGSRVDLLALMRNNILSSASSMLLRRAEFASAGGFDVRLRQAADWDLYLTMARNSAIALLNEPLSYYRDHGATVTRSTRVTLALLEDAYCVARAADWMQKSRGYPFGERRTAMRMARARVFDLFAESSSGLPAEFGFMAELIHNIVPDRRLKRVVA